MDFLELCRRRQSVRAYRPDPVPRAVIDALLEAARLAPSACNSQPWTFLVVDDPPLKTRLAAAACSGVHAMNAFARTAPVLVAVVTGPSVAAARAGGALQGTAFNRIDVAIAGEHFCLAAAERGLGTCWLGWFDAAGVKRALGLDRAAQVDLLFTLGWPADDRIREKKRKPLNAIRSFLEAPPAGGAERH